MTNKTKKNIEQHVSSLNRSRYILSILSFSCSLFLFIAFISYFISWWKDYAQISGLNGTTVFTHSHVTVENIMGRLGSFVGFKLIYQGFGIASFLFVSALTLLGLKFSKLKKISLKKTFFYHTFLLCWISLFSGTLFSKGSWSILGGSFGYEISNYLIGLTGEIGLYLLLFSSLSVFLIIAYNYRWNKVGSFISKLKNYKKEDIPSLSSLLEEEDEEEEELILKENIEEESTLSKEVVCPPTKKETSIADTIKLVERKNPKEISTTIAISEEEFKDENISTLSTHIPAEEKDGVLFTIEQVEETSQKIERIDELPTHFGIDTPYDPELELKDFQFPKTNLLVDFGDQSKQTIVQSEELIANKNKIQDTLLNYNIEITQIKATIGPTVTLYEIIPAPGVRISKIKNLEDDIALSLSALGIRIIAPIPGKGTIGIEVPNINKQMVPMKAMLESEKFTHGNFDLPIAIGKTISNECYVTDLTKMPHLLMAGATGQGKSVGLNAIIASLLYKKHPAELKFVMVDPKKVELSLFNKIERHYLAKLPDSEDAIITDTRKVVRTLNSLCLEMDIRYDLLKNAQVKNIKEYNQKFIKRNLNPNDGHRFLPYIVLIIDEFADLIMTAGKEVEQPIARLAQLARAIGIHLVIATQRPSVNIITGTIKANFPARIAFRVTSKIDSRTILDSSGAEQLIGRGDMLLSTGNEIIRLQCAFIDTPEIDKITEFIGSQRAYPSAFLLPECPDETSDGGNKEFSTDDKDPLFEEAAQLIVSTQQGSTSLIQRKLKLGYNRAGRLIDQLEAAGIVGPFEGSKSREVRIKDPIALEELLKSLN